MFSVKRKQFLIFFVPSLIVLGVTVVYPLIYSLIMSFTNASLKRQGFGEFIGLDNYIKAFKDTYFIDSGWNTIVFTVIVVTLEFLFGLAVALLLNRIKRGKRSSLRSSLCRC